MGSQAPDRYKQTLLIGCHTLLFSAIALPATAQILATPNDTNSLIQRNSNQFDITGGSQSGSNLFHSFQQFSLDPGQIANFQTTANIQNVLSRVTGGSASIIQGRLQITGSNANLYFMNPAGILFGPSASLNLPAAFTATTANGIGFSNGWFNSLGTNDYSRLTASPSQFVFTSLQPGAIVNQGNLTAKPGQSMDSSGTNGGRIQILGDRVALVGQTKLQASGTQGGGTVQIGGDYQGGGELPRARSTYVGNVSPDSIVSLLNSNNVFLEATDSINVNAPIDNISYISGGGYIPRSNLTLSATTIDVRSNIIIGGGLTATAPGGISTGNITSYTGISLTSQTGNITVETLRTSGGDITVNTQGLFRATETFDFPYQDRPGSDTITSPTSLLTVTTTSSSSGITDPFTGNISITSGGTSFLENYGSTLPSTTADPAPSDDSAILKILQ